MNEAIPFAGLAPDARTLRGAGDLSTFDLRAAMLVGQELCRRCEGDVSTSLAASHLVDLINAFEGAGGPACVLVRAFVTRRFGELPPELQLRASATIRGDPRGATYLLLIATRGLEPEWNDVLRSSSHRVLGLECSTMTTEIVRQLKVGDPLAPPATTFYVADAAASPVIPAKDFVKAYGVRSVLGFGLTPWAGESIVLLAFSRMFIEHYVARTFETVALYTKLAWFLTTDARGSMSQTDRQQSRAAALMDLLRSHENLTVEAARHWQERTDREREEARHIAAEDARKLADYNERLRRTQRAMLNVVEDLREARTALESKVEQRTRELARTNTELQARNQELEEFVYIASHDLQEPLRTVAGYLQMIERRYSGRLSSEVDEFIRFSIDGAHRMQAMIDSLLFYSRIARKDQELEDLALDAALDEALDNLARLARETGAHIERTPLPRVKADRIQMVQLFQNLLSNALKFSGPTPPRVHVSGEWAGHECTIVVRDHGVGFNPKYVDRIFKVFRRLRRDTPGTGIGLAVCKKIVERHGGRIDADSTPGRGATFVVRLPAVPPREGEP